MVEMIQKGLKNEYVPLHGTKYKTVSRNEIFKKE